jgi:hypothetical protein
VAVIRTRAGGFVAGAGVLLLLALGGHPAFGHGGDGGPYRWSRPPAAAVRTNVAPQARDGDLVVATGGASAWTPDRQATIYLPDDAFAPRPGRTKIGFALTPHDPLRFAPIADGLLADGNAYEVRLTERADGSAIDALARPGRLVLAVPYLGSVAMLWSADGQAWTRLPAEVETDGGVRTELARPGLYVAVRPSEPAAPWVTSARVVRAGLVAVGLAVAAALGVRARRGGRGT